MHTRFEFAANRTFGCTHMRLVPHVWSQIWQNTVVILYPIDFPIIIQCVTNLIIFTPIINILIIWTWYLDEKFDDQESDLLADNEVISLKYMEYHSIWC